MLIAINILKRKRGSYRDIREYRLYLSLNRTVKTASEDLWKHLEDDEPDYKCTMRWLIPLHKALLIFIPRLIVVEERKKNGKGIQRYFRIR